MLSKSPGMEPMAGEMMIPSALYSDILRMKSVCRDTDSFELHRNTVRPVRTSASSSDAINLLRNGSETLLTMTPTV